MKKRILSIGEASFALSGFGTYNYEILKRLYDTGKYEIAELACYGLVNDQRANKIPWIYYANAVSDDDPRKPQYDSNSENQWGAWRLERILLDFKPDFCCIPPGELVMTENGYKPIENITIGEKVLTHEGRFKPVIKTFKRQYNGNLSKITFKGCKDPLITTPNHPIFIHKKRNQTHKKKSFQQIYKDVKPTFCKAENISIGDLIVLPQIKEQKDTYVKTNLSLHLSKIQITPEFGRLIGYILSDGRIRSNHIKIYFDYDEENFANDAKQLYKKYFDITAKITNNFIVSIYDFSVIRFLEQWVGSHTIPKEIWKSSNQVKLGIIQGLIRGDGCYKRNTVSYCSTDKKLAHAYRILCTAVGIPTNMQLSTTEKYNIYSIDGYGKSAYTLHSLAPKWSTPPLNIKLNGKSCRTTQIINQQLVSTITKIENISYTGLVYNLQVKDDESYIVNQASTHNCSGRDPWMDAYIFRSPFRKFFNFVTMPTYDSSPYGSQWVYDYSTADGVFTYTEWALKELGKDSNNKINLLGTASPGVDLEIFKPINDIKQHRTKMGFRDDIFLVGSVMRNQKRKLFPDLLDMFKIFLSKCYQQDRPDLAQKTYLYWHSSYPDRGWDFPKLLRDSGLSHKVVFTYICQTCQSAFCAFFQDARTICPHCNSVTATLPNVGVGLSTEQLASIYQMFDCYIQYAIAGGIEMPAIEAAACGVLPMEVDYAGMSSAVRNLNGIPLKIDRKYLELETGAYRVYPDNEYCAEQLYQYLIKPTSIRKQMCMNARRGAEEHYNWDNIAKKWEDYFDNTELTETQGKWDSPPQIYNIPTSIPPNLSNTDFAKWIITNVLHELELLNNYPELDLVRKLNYGLQINGNQVQKITREQIFEQVSQKAHNQQHCEQARCGITQLTQEDYIDYANNRFIV